MASKPDVPFPLLCWLGVWCLSCVALSSAYCQGTLYYRIEGAGEGIRSVSVHRNPYDARAFRTSQGAVLNGTTSSDAQIAADGNYLCFYVVGPRAFSCMRPASGTLPFQISPSVPTGTTATSPFAVLDDYDAFAFVRLNSDGNMELNTFNDPGDGTANYPSHDESATTVSLQGFALVPWNDTFAMLYRQAGGELWADEWQKGEGLIPEGDYLKASPFGGDPVQSLVYAKDRVFAFGYASISAEMVMKAIDLGATEIASVATIDVVLPSRFSDGTKMDFLSTTRQCDSLIMMYHHASASEVGFWNPVNKAFESFFNTSGGQMIAAAAWSNAVLTPPPPSEVPSSCAPPRPEPFYAFYCDPATQLWTSLSGSLTGAPIILSNPIVVIGDLNATQSITFQGLGSSLNVTGCIDTDDTLELELVLTEEEVKELERLKTKTSLLISSNCSSTSTSLQSATFTVTAEGAKKCQKIEGKTESTGNTLSVILRFDGKQCNLWWIIVASVVGGLVVIAVIGIILLATFNKSVRSKMRPYWTRQKNPESN